MQRTERVLFVRRQREAVRELGAAFAGGKESASGSRLVETGRQVQDAVHGGSESIQARRRALSVSREGLD